MTAVWLSVPLVAAAALGLLLWRAARRRNMGPWLAPYVLQAAKRRAPRRGEPVHVLLCVGDHYEPKVHRPTPEVARARVGRWLEEYPRRFGALRDSDGRPPRHTFFYPPEEYEPEYLEALAELCRAGFGEVEIHLHHDHDAAANLRKTLLDYKHLLAERHGLLARDRHTGELAYGFIHGNWALCNSRPDGRWCGVDDELDVLRETGCYADFTMPSAPDPTQTRKINSIYYARTRPGRRKSHDRGVDVGTAPAPAGSLMMVQGPLLLNWGAGRFLRPRIENGCLQANQPPTMERLDLWLKARVQVPGRPDWFFVKLHAHGAREDNADMHLGEPTVRFHQELAARAAADPNFHFHYVTARELYNLARAAEAGWTGSVEGARDYRLVWDGPTAAAVAGARAGAGPAVLP